MLNGRKRTASVLATLCITAASGSMLAASPTFADPEVDDVQARVDSLFEKAEQASERYNDARLDLEQAQSRLTALRADLARQQAKVETVRSDVAAAVVSQYQGQALSTTTQVLLADDPDAFLDQLATISGYNDQQAEMMADFAVQADQLEMREAAAQRELERIAATKKTLAQEKAEIDDKAAEAKALLDRLEARSRPGQPQQRYRPTSPTSPPPVGAGAAVQYALGSGRRRLRLRRRRPGRLRLLWPDDDGVGGCRRRAPALLERPDGLGHACLQSQLAPGDLVFYYSAGEPRRHLHRQRPGRARR